MLSDCRTAHVVLTHQPPDLPYPWLALPQLMKIWADFRAPCRLHNDNGKEFKGAVKRACKKWGVVQVRGRPYRPQVCI